MVRSVVVLTVLLALGVCTPTVAQERLFGLGIILSEPTGLRLKRWRGDTTAIAGAIASAFDRRDTLHLHADYLFHNLDLSKVERDIFAFHYGMGGRVKITNGGSRAGVPIPVGINYILKKAPLDVFFGPARLLDLVPSTNFELERAAGVRYFFCDTGQM